jgi:hypothetical protein
MCLSKCYSMKERRIEGTYGSCKILYAQSGIQTSIQVCGVIITTELSWYVSESPR